MATNERQLLVSVKRCIGCRACATVCPKALVTLSDTDHRRTVWFAAVCREDCTRCVEACPTEAISLPTITGAVSGEGTRLDFELRACAACGAPVATPEMLEWLRAAIPPEVQTDVEGTQWLELCPRCRQKLEAQQVAREVVMTRWA